MKDLKPALTDIPDYPTEHPENGPVASQEMDLEDIKRREEMAKRPSYSLAHKARKSLLG